MDFKAKFISAVQGRSADAQEEAVKTCNYNEETKIMSLTIFPIHLSGRVAIILSNGIECFQSRPLRITKHKSPAV